MENILKWPNESKMAALLTVNLDGEQFWKGMFPEANSRPKTLSMGDYGINRGLDRVLKTYREYNIKSTFFIPGIIVENHPEAIEKILKDGHEIALHGHTHRPLHLLSLEEQEEELELGKAAIKKVTGKCPIGYRAPEGELFIESLNLVAKAGFIYSSSLYDGDKPYRMEGLEKPLIEIPMNWNTHDFPYFAFNYGPAFPSGQGRVSSYQRVMENYIQEFDAYLAYGLAYVAQFTPQSIGSPGKIQILEKILEHICKQDKVWIGTCEMLVNQISKG